MASVHLRNVTVNFPIYDARSRSLKRRAMSLVTGGRVRSDPTGRISTDASHRVLVRALDRVDLTIEHGTRIGLIGRNGAGKSTLLHVLAGIYVPEYGTVAVDGKIAPCWRQPRHRPGALRPREHRAARAYLGLSKKEIHERMEEVIAFTELGPFIEMPFRSYSAGMRARLDFAISTAIEAEILLLDEGLGAGDASFIEKANERVEKLAAAAGIIVVATIRRCCCARPAPRRSSWKLDASLLSATWTRCWRPITHQWRPEALLPRVAPSR